MNTPSSTFAMPSVRASGTEYELEELRSAVTGHLFTAADPGWDDQRRPWALSVEQCALAVLHVADVRDVQIAVRWAARHGVQVSAQPVGHGAGDPLDGVLLLRTGALQQIQVDLHARTASVGAGVKAGALLRALEGTGLTFLVGSNADPTVVGLSITGGMSWFGRAYGLAANSIVSVLLVDATGRLLRVTRSEHTDLFWALRGGGGDFGIIVAVDICLHPGVQVYGGRLLWPVTQMPAVLRAFRQVCATAPDGLTLWYHTYRFPPLPQLPETIRGKAFAGVALANLGTAAETEALIAPLRAVADLTLDFLTAVPLSELSSIADEPNEPTPTMEHSFFLTDLDDATLDALTDVAGAGSGSPLAFLQIRHLGGALARVSPDDGAAGHVEEPFLLFALGIPAAPGSAQAITATFARLDTGLAQHTNGRTVPNFVGPLGNLDRVWSPATRARLGHVKCVWDPHGTIRSNRPVLPDRPDRLH